MGLQRNMNLKKKSGVKVKANVAALGRGVSSKCVLHYDQWKMRGAMENMEVLSPS